MRKYRPPVIDIVRPFLGAIVGIVVLTLLFGFRLDSVGPGVNLAESDTVLIVQSRSLSARDILLQDPLYLPHKVGLYALEKLGLTSLGALRSVGASFAIIATISMYLILKHWHTRRIAIMGSILFATSSWLLHSSRLAVPEVSYLLLPVLIFLGTKLEQGKRPFVTLSVAILVSVVLLYVPGLVWLIIPAFLWQRKRLFERLSGVNRVASGLVLLLALVLIMPLIYTLVLGRVSWQLWLGYNGNFTSVIDILQNLAQLPVRILLRNEANPLITVGQLPFLDIATSILVLLGGYWYFFQRKLDRARLMVGGLLITMVLIAVNGPMLSALMLPFVYLLATAGLTLMLQQWFTVFPRNPLARGIALVLVSLVIGLIGFYHLNRYFVAWPNSPETKATFRTDI